MLFIRFLRLLNHRGYYSGPNLLAAVAVNPALGHFRAVLKIVIAGLWSLFDIEFILLPRRNNFVVPGRSLSPLFRGSLTPAAKLFNT